MELLPLKATFAPDEPVRIELRGAEAGAEISLWSLDAQVAHEQLAPGHGLLEFPPLTVGGYGVEARAHERTVSTAFDVLDDPLQRPRYGFVADFAPGRDPAPVGENIRRLHLNAIQFYDWMYRHARLLPPADEFVDPLGRRLSLASVRALVAELRACGALSLAYAAVYAAGREEWPHWHDDGLYRPDGRPWMLEDFLWIVDPTSETWLSHFTRELTRAADTVGFDGFHLDQYGQPKHALRADGSEVDLALALPKLIARVRERLPAARLIFNNVNDFPTWTTAAAPQDALYIEVWPPHERLNHLAKLIASARAHNSGKPVILAAYMSVFESAPEEDATSAAKLVLATIFSHGGHPLLVGEDGRVLTGPYYPDNHVLSEAGFAELRQWYDFAVRYGDLLYDGAAVDVTTALIGGINEDVHVLAPVPVSVDAEAGALWARASQTKLGLAFHLIDLTGQGDLNWDAPRRPAREVTGVRLRLLRTGTARDVAVTAPESHQRMQRLEIASEGAYDLIALPPWRTWLLVLVRDR